MTKLVTFHYHQADTKYSSFVMNCYNYSNAPFRAHLLALIFKPNLKWNSQIRSITKDAGNIVISLKALQKVTYFSCLEKSL